MDYLIIVVLILVFLAGFVLASSIYTLPARTPPPPPASTAKSTTIDLPEYECRPEDFEPPQAWPPPDNCSPLTVWPITDYRPAVLNLAERINKRQKREPKP